MANQALEVFNNYLAAQAEGDIDKVMQLISDDATFDVGRGVYTDDGIRHFHERLQDINSVTEVIEVNEVSPEHITALLDQSDEDLKPLGIEKIQLDADIATNEQGQIRAFTARPTPASLALIASARDTGRTSEGVKLAEQAGTLLTNPSEHEKQKNQDA